MKTVIGFVCGIAGMILSIVVFVLGVATGFMLDISDKVTVNKKED